VTSEYDKLRTIHENAKEKPELRVVAEWLLDICIEQANHAKEKWNFESWQKSKLGELYVNADAFEQKAAFIDDCHDFLAHRQIEAFDYDTLKLIGEVYNAFVGDDVYDVDKLKKRFPALPSMLESLAYKPLDKVGWMWAK
jgi:hypothetical protein